MRNGAIGADTSQRMQTQRPLREKLSLWDAKASPQAPLTEKQKDSFIELTTLASNRLLPKELPLDDFPVITHRFSSGTTEQVPESQDLFNSNEKIENAQQFFKWFSEVESQIEVDEEQAQRQYISELLVHRSECDKILDEVTEALNHLEELTSNYVAVSTKTNALHEACEHLLAEQTKLVNIAENIGNKLSYFNELERISSKIGSPTLTVTNESFIPMLSRLDECIAYLNKNPQYKESGNYLAKFKQCLSRALNLIKTHVFTILQNATQQVMPKKEVTNLADDAFTLFYGKFRTNAPRIRSLMDQIESRTDASPEYQQLLNDCHQCYFQQRLQLLGPSVYNAVTELAQKHKRDHCALVRSGCAFIVHICEDEYQLFYHFFSKHTPLLEKTLETLCCHLYDVLRPLIIHIQHLETLAELCSILKLEMLEEHVNNNPVQLAAFENICSQLLEDVQERLVYRTHIYIRAEILNYNPALGDLAYPDKLQMMESIAASLKEQRTTSSHHSRNPSTASSTSLEVAEINRAAAMATGDAAMAANGVGAVEGYEPPKFVSVPLDITSSNMPMSPADLHGMWYPTVRRTLVCLSKLYRCIDKSTFQGLSQETLTMCIKSLVSASNHIRKNKSPLDALLFLIKHLLILREQIAPFHVDFMVKETNLDFSKIKEAAFGLVKHRSRLFSLNTSNALLQFLLDDAKSFTRLIYELAEMFCLQKMVKGTPQVTETIIDSKKEVDNELKKTCEEFIGLVTMQFIGPMQEFLQKANTVLEIQRQDGLEVSLRQQPFASPEVLQDVVAQTYKNLKTKKPTIQTSMALYLANKDTEYILFKPIKSNVQQCFQQLHQFLQRDYSEEDQQIVACPSLEQINLLLAATSGKAVVKQAVAES